jgi:hypothetical protein
MIVEGYVESVRDLSSFSDTGSEVESLFFIPLGR